MCWGKKRVMSIMLSVTVGGCFSHTYAGLMGPVVSGWVSACLEMLCIFKATTLHAYYGIPGLTHIPCPHASDPAYKVPADFLMSDFSVY